MRIALDVREIQTFPTGIGRYLRGLIYGLQKIEVPHPHQFTLLANPNNPLLSEFKPVGFKLPSDWAIRVVKARPKTISQHWRLPRELKREKFDLLLTNPFGYSTFLSQPYVIVILDMINRRYPGLVSWKARFYEKLLAGRAAKNAKLILTDSYFSRSDIVKFLKIEEERVVVTHLAADPIFHQKQPQALRQNVRQKFGIKDDFILYVGNRRPHKNLKFLLRVFSRLKSEQSAGRLSRLLPQLVLVGGVDQSVDTVKKGQKDEVSQLIKGLKINQQVILTGHISDQDLAALYQEALFLAHPALIEGFGLTTLEAMASGCPVVASNAASIPEVVKQAGILLDPRDQSSWVEAMASLIERESLRMSLKEKGLARAKEFNWEKTARETLEALITGSFN